MTTTPAPQASDRPDRVEGDHSLPKRMREAWMKTVGTFATDDNGTARISIKKAKAATP